MKILVLDDHKSIVDDLIYELKEIMPDAECTGISEPAEALALIKDHSYHIAFLDIEMPELNGIEFAKKILAKDPRTNIIYITAHSGYAVECFKTYASAFLEKPIDRDELVDALGHLRFPVSNITDEMVMQEFSGNSMIGKRIVRLREESGMSRQDFIKAMDVSAQTVYRWENGERIPSMATYMKIMQVLGVDIDKML
ncbi:response regulator [Ruminococcus sp.]|uniref:response regulator n=1 Tax=Ruminococcus sp. TaxID=41978 RepID=UPI001B01C0B9|nr:response regulator [Ruminococcus sp.]MBO5557654.1 response regulator [Ruminococcus sp.]